MGACAAGIAKTFVILFSLITFILSVAVLAIAGASLADTFVADLMSDHTSYACLATGIVLFLISMMGCTGTCWAKTRKCSLTVITLFTFIVFICSTASFVVVYLYGDIVSLAAENNFTIPDGQTELATAESTIYNEVKAGWNSAFDGCAPVVYDTTNLNDNYCTGHDDYCVDGTTNLASDKTYMYCSSPAPTTLVYPSADSSELPEAAIASKGFGWWVSEYCLPAPALFTAAMDSATAGDDSNAFSACYLSSWWDAGALTAGAALLDWLPAGQAFNSKAAFCFCAVSAEGSGLWQRIVAYSAALKWVSLGLCIFFLLAFIAECYLLCCRKKDLEDYYADSSTNSKEVDMRRP